MGNKLLMSEISLFDLEIICSIFCQANFSLSQAVDLILIYWFSRIKQLYVFRNNCLARYRNYSAAFVCLAAASTKIYY